MKRYFILLGILLTFSTSGLVFAQGPNLYYFLQNQQSNKVQDPLKTFRLGPGAEIIPSDESLKSQQKARNNEVRQKYRDALLEVEKGRKQFDVTDDSLRTFFQTDGHGHHLYSSQGRYVKYLESQLAACRAGVKVVGP